MRTISILMLLCGCLSARAAENRLWLDAKVNGTAVRLCFDTGSDRVALLRDVADRLGLKVTNPPPNAISPPGQVPLGRTEECDLTVEGNTIRTTLATFTVPPGLRLGIDGVVGWSALRQNILFIDAENLAIRFLDELPDQVRSWTQVQIDTNSDILRLEALNERGEKETVLVDTGTGTGVELPPQEWSTWQAAHRSHPMALEAIYTLGEGWDCAKQAWADSLTIGPLVLTDVPIIQASRTSVTLGSAHYVGTLGISALKRLDVVLDGAHGKAYFRSKQTSPPPYKYNRLGAAFVPPDSQSSELIAHVLKHSPAYKAGIRSGDLLLAIDGVSVANWRNDTNGMDIDDVFRRPAGTQLSLSLKRNGNTFETKAMLRQILSPDSHRQSQIQEELLGEFHEHRANQVLSQDGVHVAYCIFFQSGKQCVVVDGRVGEQYDGICADTLLFSPDSRHLAFVAISGRKQFVVLDGKPESKFDGTGKGSLVFSLTGEHLAYVAVEDDRCFAVVDGKPGPGYQGMVGPFFSPEGHRVAYCAKEQGKWFVVESGRPKRQFTANFPTAPVFSPDGKHLAYCTSMGGQRVVVLDGKVEPFYDEVGCAILSFSFDSKRLMYAAEKNGKWFAVIGAKEGPQFDGLWNVPILSSPDSKRAAYVVNDGDRWRVVVDGKPGPRYEGITSGSLHFSRDSKHLIYAVSGAKSFVVKDGKPEPEYDGIVNGTLVLSPDSKRLAYCAGRGNKRFVVVDGQEGPEYDGMGVDSLRFSANSRRVGYSAGKAGKQFVVVDGQAGPAYDGILNGTPIFSPDSKHFVYAASTAWKCTKWCVVVDGVCRAEWDDVITNSVSFHSNEVLQYLAVKGAKLYRVHEML